MSCSALLCVHLILTLNSDTVSVLFFVQGVYPKVVYLYNQHKHLALSHSDISIIRDVVSSDSITILLLFNQQSARYAKIVRMVRVRWGIIV